MANIFEINRPTNKITLGTTGTTINVASHTASKILALDASKNLEVVTIGTSLNYARPTLNTIQDIRTTASPEFANLSLGTGELTTGSINRGAGTLTLEIAGTAEISITSTTVTFGGNLVIPDTGYIGSASDPNAIRIAASGEVTFTDVATGILPTTGAHLATKEYVDLAIGSSKDYFLSDNNDPVIAAYHILYETDTGEVASTEVTAAMGINPDQLMFSFITPAGVPGVTFLRSGVYVLHTHLAMTTGNRTVVSYWTLSKYTTGDVETVLMTSETSSAIPGSMASFITHAILSSDAAIDNTDRLVLKLYANVTGGGANSVITIYMEGTNDCHLTNLLPSSIWQTQDDVLDDISALAVVANNEFIVGDGAGSYAHESGATVRTSLGLGTGDSPQFTGIELGHANDTTITRTGAGAIAVEGVGIMLVGDAPTAHSIASHNDTTGTGAELNTLTDGSDAGALHSHAAAYQPLDDILTDLADLTAVADNEFIVGTGAGTYAHENAATAATSMGLGTGDSPTFTGLTLSGTALVEGASVTIGKASTTTGTIVLHDSNSANTITLTVPDITAGSLTFTLPPTDGDNLDVLQTNGSGVLTWVALGGQTQGDVLDDLNTLGANPFTGDPNPDFLVGTSAGTLAWQSGATARTSIGLGTGDSPTFSNLTVTNTFSITDLSTTGDTQLGDNVALDNIGINIAPDADVLIKGSFASTGSGDDFCYNNELFTHTEDDSTASTYIYGTNSSMTVNDDLTVNGTFIAVGHKQFLEAGLTTITGVGNPVAYLYGYHAVVDWAAASLGAVSYAACLIGFKADVTGNLGTVGNTIKWGVDISVSESAVTHYGGRFTAQGATYNYGVWGYTTGAHTTNYGLYGYAAGATTNWGLYVAAGNAFFAGIVSIEGASVTVGKASTTTGTLVLHDSGSANTITLTVPDSLAASLTFTLPPTDGDNTDVLQTNGSGVLTWVAAGADRSLSEYTDEDSETNAMLKSHAYLAATDGMVYGVLTSAQAGKHLEGYVETATQYGIDSDPVAGGIAVQYNHVGITGGYKVDISFEVAEGEYFEVITNADEAPAIYWKSRGTLSKPVDQD